MSLFLTMLMLITCVSGFSVNAEIDTSRGRSVYIDVKTEATASGTTTESGESYTGQAVKLDGADPLIRSSHSGVTGEYITFTVNAPMAGDYKVTLNGYYSWGGAWIDLYYGDTASGAGAQRGIVPTTQPSGNVTQWNYNNTGTKDIEIALMKGENILSLKPGQNIYLKGITFTYAEPDEKEINYSEFDYIDGETSVRKDNTVKDISDGFLEAWTLKYQQQYNKPMLTLGNSIGIDADFLMQGKYKVTLKAGKHPDLCPEFVLTNGTNKEELKRKTSTEGYNNSYTTANYEMGEMNIKSGDVLTLKNITSGGNTCFESLIFTWIGEYEISDTIYIDAAKDYIANESLDSTVSNGRVGFTTMDGYMVFNANAPLSGDYKVTFENIYTYSDEWVRFYKYDGEKYNQIAAGHFCVNNADASEWTDNSGTKEIVVPLTKGENKLKVKIASASGRYIDGITFKYTEPSSIEVNFNDFDYIDRETSFTKNGATYTIGVNTFQEVWESGRGWSWAWGMPVMANDFNRNLSMIFDGSLKGGDYVVKIKAGGSNSEDTAPKFELVNEMTGETFTVETDNHGRQESLTETVVGTMTLSYGDVITVKNKGATTYFKGLIFEKPSSITLNGSANGALEAEGYNTFTVPENYLGNIDKDVTIFVALYDNGLLYDVNFEDYQKTGDTSVTVEAPEDITNVTYKIFFWEKGTCAPVREAYPEADATTNTVYVSSSGLDMNDGNEATPVASLQRAKELANEKKGSIDNDIYIIVEEGEYQIESELSFSVADSGVNGHKIIIKGNEDGKTVVNGGVELTSWQGSGELKTASSEKLTKKIRHLSVDDEYKAMSRSPKITKDDISLSGDKLVVTNGALEKSDLSALENEKNAELYAVVGFSDVRIPIKEFSVGESVTTITLDEKATAIADYTTDDVEYPAAQRFINGLSGHNSQYFGGVYIENALLFTDTEGEFYSDAENKKICYYTNGDPTEMKIYAPVSEGLMSFNGVKNITVSNITFKNGAWDRPSVYGLVTRQAEKYDVKKNEFSERGGDLIKGQISFNNCENIEFKNNTVLNSGSTAIALRQSNKSCEITGNTVKNSAGGAISVGMPIDRARDTENILIKNNDIDNTGLQYRSCPAVTVYFANDVKILHNDINNASYTGVSLGLSWSEYVANVGNYEVAYNKISNVMTETDDGAHIYTNGPNILGTVIHDNYLVKGNNKPNGQSSNDRGGIYFDNGSCNITAYNNVIEECGAWLFAVDANLGKYCPTNGKNCENGCSDNSRTCTTSALSVYDNYSDSSVYVNKSENVSVAASSSNTTDAAMSIKNTAGLEK